MDQNVLKKERDSLVRKINTLEAEYKSAGKKFEERKACITAIANLRKALTEIQVKKLGALSMHRQHGQLINRTHN